jgi:hypothetical protein
MGIYFGFTGYVLAVRKALPPEIVKSVIRSTVITAVINGIAGIAWGFDNAAHFGGGVTGFALGLGFGLQPPFHEGLAVKLRWSWTVLILVAFAGCDLLLLSTARSNAVAFLEQAQYASTREMVAKEYNDILIDYRRAVECVQTELAISEAHSRFEVLRTRFDRFYANPEYQEILKTDSEIKTKAGKVAESIPKLRNQLCTQELDRIFVLAQGPTSSSENPDSPAPDVPPAGNQPLNPAKAYADLQILEAWPEFQAELKTDQFLRKRAKIAHELLATQGEK